MGLRFRVFALLAVLGAFLVPAPAALAEPGSWVDPPAKMPRVAPRDRVKNLDFLFGALKAAPDETSAKAIEDRIWALWFQSPSPTANLLMGRVKTAVDAQDTDLALKLLDSIVQIKPDYVEAWNRRATLYFNKKDFSRAIADIRQVLALEPRHFGAMAGLGLILQEIGNEKQALEIFRRALAIYPRLPRIPEIVKTLSEKIEGRDI